MADNFQANPGSGGSTFAADDVGSGLLVPRMKKVVGPDGVYQDGWTPHRKTSAASTNATNVKSTSGQLGFILCINVTATIRYLKFYNQSGTPAPATDNANLVAVIPIPANAAGAGAVIPIPDGLNFSSGIGYAMTANASDTDNTAIAAGDLFLVLGYV